MSTLSLDLRRPRTWITIGAFVALVIVVGGLIGLGAMPDAWYAALRKPPFNPPNWVFGPVWFILYVLIGIAGARSFLRDAGGWAMRLWVIQMLLNWAWSPTWFAAHQLWAALVIVLALLVTILGFIATSWRSDRTAAWLFVPYAAWVSFASLLNLSIALLN